MLSFARPFALLLFKELFGNNAYDSAAMHRPNHTKKHSSLTDPAMLRFDA